ncbi:hypothetical protein E3U43_009714 [Larimichthys crocea]|uniref:Uncharacterized protein n=1 Tax=Larimichthys crocea TaxID=215358 RepID=A0ACD3QBR7_LARCR|nr:hypothetical protein E3U43_009714 [Larimichthys crocea]
MTVLRLDVNREEDIRGAAERVKESFGRLDIIVNSSAMLHPSGKGETSLRDVSAQGIISTLTTNTVGSSSHGQVLCAPPSEGWRWFRSTACRESQTAQLASSSISPPKWDLSETTVLVVGTATECLKQLSTWQPGICL